jgi:hypothetical protein
MSSAAKSGASANAPSFGVLRVLDAVAVARELLTKLTDAFQSAHDEHERKVIASETAY